MSFKVGDRVRRIDPAFDEARMRAGDTHVISGIAGSSITVKGLPGVTWWARKFELASRKEEEMHVFKPGEWVEAITESGCKGFLVGQLYLCSGETKDHCVFTEADSRGKRNGWGPVHFKKAGPRTELESLVATANAGLVARLELRAKYAEQVTVHITDPNNCYEGYTLKNYYLTGEATIKEFRIPPKPKAVFEPYTMKEGHKVLMKDFGDAIKVGCQEFKTAELQQALRAICREGGSHSSTDGQISKSLVATRVGITYADKHKISYESADQLLTKLEAYLAQKEK